MMWPSATPNLFKLPTVNKDDAEDDGMATDPHRDEKVISLAISKAGYMLVAITWRAVYVFRPKPFCPVAAYIRSDQSISEYGDNETVLIRPDGQVIAVATSQGCVLTFAVISHANAREVMTFGNILEDKSNVFLGPGESVGVRELKLRFKTVYRVESQISQALALDEALLIVTKDPQALQLVKWDSNDSLSRTHSTLISDLDWIPDTELVTYVTKSRAMSLFAFITYSGVAYTATLNEASSKLNETIPTSSNEGSLPDSTAESSNTINAKLDGSSNDPTFSGHKFHEPSGFDKQDNLAVRTAINARFSVVAVGCTRGKIFLYNIRDYNGSTRKIRSIDPPSSSTGMIQLMKWSSDGYGLFVGYENGWALFSVYGMLNASSFLSKQEQKQSEAWLDGIKEAVWSFSGDTIFIIPNNGQLWSLNVRRWSACGNYTSANLHRPILFTDTQLMLYRGQEQSDTTTIDRDALQWMPVSIPVDYVADNWPIRFVTCSDDGRYVAISGIRGLAHYSVHSGRWKLFTDTSFEQEFTVRGGMVWYHHLLIVACDDDSGHEVRVYSREHDLAPQYVMCTYSLPGPAVKLSMHGDLLLVYTYDNTLHFFRVVYNDNLHQVQLELQHEISFDGIVQAPARVRAISCFVTGPVKTAKECPLLMLVDGMLVLLRPKKDEKNSSGNAVVEYRKTTLHPNIEYYIVSTVNSSSASSATAKRIWAFDGQDMLVWLHDLEEDQSQTPCVIPVESYPLSVLLNKGIIMGVESDTVLPREASFTYFKLTTTSQLFVPHILEAYLRMDDESDSSTNGKGYDRALATAREYLDLKYFAHILEMLLYRILDSEAGQPECSSTLIKALKLLKEFPEMLDILVGCTRKTEVSYWKKLFDAAGSPHDMFEECIQLGKLKTAGGYLLVLHNLHHQFEDNTEDTVTLMRLAHQTGDWELCKELARFLTAVDQTGETLKKVLDAVGIVYKA